MPKTNENIEKPFSPSRSYKIRLRIKGIDYSNELINVKISSSLATGYQIVVLTIMITPNTIILDKLYGQDSIELNISLLDQAEYENENMSFSLMVLNSEFEMAMAEMVDSEAQKDRTSFLLTTVTRIPFQIMSTNAGCIFGYGKDKKWLGNKTVRSMITTMIEEFAPSAGIEYDLDGENLDIIPQCCIPPNSLYKAIKLIDDNHGIYNGIPVVFCQYDNTIQIMNLSARINYDYTIYVEHLTLDHNMEDVTKSMKDKSYFYTYDNLYTNYIGNAKFGILGNTLKHIVLPGDKLSHTITQDLSTLCANYGIIGSGSKEPVYIDKTATGRTTYYISSNGDDLSETHAISRIAKQISALSKVSFSVERGLPIEDLIKIGGVVKLGTKTVDYIELSGKYILFSSDIVWNKEGEWQTTAKLELIRTNKTL